MSQVIEKKEYLKTKSMIFVPINTNDNRYIIALENYNFNEIKELVSMLKETMKVILQRLELYIKLDKSSNKDILTGLGNRNSYAKKVDEIDKKPEDYTLALFDLFRLKYVNDNYSHTIGDKYIIGVARILEKYFPRYYYASEKDGTLKKHKTSSCIYRIGGDEFALITTEEEQDSVELKTELLKEEAKFIDLGIKDFATISNGKVFKNINKTSRIKKLEKKLKREQRRLSRKYGSLKKNPKKQEGRATRQNIQKQVLKVQKLHQKLTNIRTDYINQTASSIIGQNPSSITIEDLDVKGMMKNRHLSKAVAQQKFYEFRVKLEIKCKTNGIELRVVDRFYPSSKLCSCCGHYHKELKLSDRTYQCDNCDTSIDRDFNASVNLKNAKEYKIA